MTAPCDHSFCHEDHSDCVNHADCTWFCDPSQDDESDEPGYPDEDAAQVPSTDVVKRLAAALAAAGYGDNYKADVLSDALANGVLTKDLELAEAAAIGLAFLAAQKALPEGWVIELGDYPARDRYWAQAIGPEIDAQHPTVDAFGPTAQAALEALRKALDDR